MGIMPKRLEISAFGRPTVQLRHTYVPRVVELLTTQFWGDVDVGDSTTRQRSSRVPEVLTQSVSVAGFEVVTAGRHLGLSSSAISEAIVNADAFTDIGAVWHFDDFTSDGDAVAMATHPSFSAVVCISRANSTLQSCVPTWCEASRDRFVRCEKYRADLKYFVTSKCPKQPIRIIVAEFVFYNIYSASPLLVHANSPLFAPRETNA